MSKMLISYINKWAAGTVTASSEHPSFPAINTQHRWFKKPWRSRYGASSGWGLFRVTTANQNIYFGEQKLLNGRMETWASATDLSDWSESLAGTSTVNREATTIKYGTYSCRFDIDGSNSVAGISQSVVLAAGAEHKISFWHNTPIGSTLAFHFKDSANNVYLAADGTWTAANTYIHATGTGDWAFFTLDFNAHASYTNYALSILRGNSMTSKSQYIDDVSISQKYTAALTVGDYDATTLAAEIKTRMDAAGGTYTVTYPDTTNKFTIAGSQTFVLYFLNITNAAWGLIGFSLSLTYDSAISTTITATYIRIHSSEILYGDAGETTTLRFISIKGHNLQSTALVYVRYYSDAFLTLVDSETLTWHEAQIAARTAQSYRCYSIEISDPDNPAGYIEVGLVWAGDASVLHYGFTADREETPEDPSIETESEDGQGSTIQLSHYLERTYTFDAVEPNTDRALLRAAFAEIGKTRPCFIVESPPASGDVGEDAEYVKIFEWTYQHIAGKYWGLEIAIRSER
jgi:hypothetical protein